MPFISLNPMGDYTGYDDEEEQRRRREETVRTQTIKTAGDGSQTVTTQQQLPAPPSQPVDPAVFNRMIQAESGGQQTTPTGQILTSPAGAQGIAQIMPSTARQPGYGIQPASPEEIQTKAGNQAFGQRYFQGMLKAFGGDQQKAVAAYNAGPGRVEQAVQHAAANGGSWLDYLPKETMQYLGKIFGNMIPSAQAQTTPANTNTVYTAPSGFQAAQSQFDPNTGRPTAIPGAGVQGTQQTPEQAQAEQAQGQGLKVNAFKPMIDSQSDQMSLVSLHQNEKEPEWKRRWAGEQLYNIYRSDVSQAQAKQAATSLISSAAQGDRQSANTIAKELQSSNGSWLKMLLLGFISPELAGEEAIKLGFGNRWTSQTDDKGNPVLIQTNARGLPLKGYTQDGYEIPTNELVAYAGGKRNLDIVGGTYVNDKTGEVGRVVTDKNTGNSYIQTDRGRQSMTGWRPQSSQGTLENMRTRALQELQIKLIGKTKEEAMQIARPYNQMLLQNGFPIIQPDELPINVPQVEERKPGAAAPVAGPAPAPVTGGAVAPVTGTAPLKPQQPATIPGTQGAGMGGRPTGPQMESSAAGQKKFATETAEDLAKVQNNQPKNEQTSDYLIAKIDQLISHPGFEVSVGLSAQPYFQHIPGTDKANWYARFKEVKGQAFLQAFDSLRGGGQITEKEGTAATEALTRMSTSQSEAEFKEAANDFVNVVKRSVDRNRQRLGQEPKYGTSPETEIQAEKREKNKAPLGSKENPIKIQ